MGINKILIGIVGYSPVLDSYPLGPNLMNNLNERDWINMHVDVQNMTWSPIHVTQRLQENKLEFDRVVLVGSKTISTQPGKVECYKWESKEVDEIKIQEDNFFEVHPPLTSTAIAYAKKGFGKHEVGPRLLGYIRTT